MTSPFTERRMSVTSSGRSSTRSTIRCTSGLLASMEWAICFMTVVLPALGGDTIMPRWPLPIGESRSTMRAVTLSLSPGISRLSRESGNSGVRSSKRGRLRACLGVEARDRVDAQQRRVLLVVRRRPARALDVVAPAQREAAGLADRDVDVLGRGQVAVAAQEAVALVAQVEQALHLDQLARVGLLLAAALELAALAAVAAAAPAAAPVAHIAVGLVAVLVWFWLFWFWRLRLPCWLGLWFCPFWRRRRGRRRRPARAARRRPPVRSHRRRPPPPRWWSPGRRPRPASAVVAATGVGLVVAGAAVAAGVGVAGGLGVGGGGPARRRDGLAPLASVWSASAVARSAPFGPGGHAGGIEDLVNDVGLLGPGRRLERHGLGDGTELVALLAFENRSFELLFRSHRAPLLEGHRRPGCRPRVAREFQGGEGICV